MQSMPRAIQDVAEMKMRPELELLIRAARPASTENDDRIHALLSDGLNWDEVMACAHEHKLGPLLQERFGAMDAPGLPPDQKEKLAELARELAKNNLVYMGEMLSLCGTFETAGIPAVPFKGPALAWLAYRSFALRTCVDLDFVVPQRYIPQAMSALQAIGYFPQFDPIEAHAGQRGSAPGQYAFAPNDKRRFLELHTERTLRYFSRPLNLDEMNSRAIPLEIGGRNVRTFSVEDLLVMLCVHGAKHFWERLAWIVDIGQLISAQNVDWTRLLGIAEQMESTRFLLLGLYLAHEVVEAQLPPDVLELACKDRQVRWLAAKVLGQYAGTSDPGAGVLSRAVFRFCSSDGIWQGLRQLLRLSTSPTESDRRKVKLPAFLSSFYGIVRPLRLIGEYGLGLKRRPKLDLAIYEATPPEFVDQMLRLAEISPGDILYDLGCGDGRIVVAAAEKYGIRAVGMDINPRRIAEARANARKHGVEDRVEFRVADAKNADVSGATVVTLYLETNGLFRLVERLRTQLRPGARIVSRTFKIYGWKPDRSETHTLPSGTQTALYLWTIKEAGNATSVDEDGVPELRQIRKAGG
jgi:Uncharacterised nucleotidyltransferase/Methyltransferase domain